MYWSAGSSHSGIRAAEYITVANIFWLWNALACNAFLFFLTRNVEGLTYVGGMLQSCKYGVTYRDKKKIQVQIQSETKQMQRGILHSMMEPSRRTDGKQGCIALQPKQCTKVRFVI